MKVYELQFRAGDHFDEDSFVLWIKTDGELTGHSAVVCNEIEIGEGMPGLDAVVEVESHEHIIITRKKVSVRQEDIEAHERGELL